MRKKLKSKPFYIAYTIFSILILAMLLYIYVFADDFTKSETITVDGQVYKKVEGKTVNPPGDVDCTIMGGCDCPMGIVRGRDCYEPISFPQ